MIGYNVLQFLANHSLKFWFNFLFQMWLVVLCSVSVQVVIQNLEVRLPFQLLLDMVH